MKNSVSLPVVKKELAILGCIIILAFCFRLFKLTGYGLQYEEIYSFVFPGLFRYSLNFSSAQPTYLYNFFMHYLQAWTSNEWVLRMPSVFWGVASVPCVYLIGKKVTGDGLSGLLGAFLLAVSPFHVYFSQELRMYPLVAFLGAASAYF
ncbi:MAG: glycosyltransferase family 39 protein, partial [Candidatus Omnitrophica bacterium]|nr:glycosyltransferase family 39 protein [Candidatus Omnitrophota bacterium]